MPLHVFRNSVNSISLPVFFFIINLRLNDIFNICANNMYLLLFMHEMTSTRQFV